VADLFGGEVLASDGSVDRARLAARVLVDSDALARLDGAIHPLVRARVAAWLEDLCEASPLPPAAVVEAALLVETGSSRDYDLLAVVWCRPEQQLERALARGLPAARAEELMAAQLPMKDKLAVADVAIDNSGDRAALVAEVERAWQLILSHGDTGD
jgi:dephospho-CoA kinase